MLSRSLRWISIAFAWLPLTAGVALAAWPHDPTVNVPLAVGSGNRQFHVATADGSGGILVAWEDYRSGTSRIYAQHVLADGTIAPGWSANGNEVKSTIPNRALNIPSICSDGAGGAIIAWRENFSIPDRDLYAQRMSASGVQLWGTAGAAIAISTYDQDQPRLVSDGAGNALIVWQEDHTLDGTGIDIYANRIGPNGSNRWGPDGVIICNAANDQLAPALTSDGAGGLTTAWTDRRGPNVGIFAVRRDSSGALHSGWTANGTNVANGFTGVSNCAVIGNSTGGALIAWVDDRNGAGTQDVLAASLTGNAFMLGFLGGSFVCTAPGTQSAPLLAPDGADGAFVTWADNRTGSSDVYAQHLTSSAAIANGWPAVGVGLPVFTAAQLQIPYGIVSDGAGGCIISMFDNSLIRGDIYAAHLTASGGIAEGWNAQVPVCTAIADQASSICVSDGAAGAILAWMDQRNGNAYDLYAQRIEKWGRLGNPEPAIVSVKDVPNDQGGSVRVSWNASYLDAYPNFPVASYWLWRQVPASLAEAALRGGRARLLAAGEDAPAGPQRRLRAVPIQGLTTYWEYVTSQVANAFPSYSLVASTQADSTPGSNPRTLFMVEARGSGHIAWGSAPDSGYSVDNVAPPAPAPFEASYTAGTTYLKWSPPAAPDLAGYRLYRGTGPGFVPGPGNLIGAPGDTLFADFPGGFYYYKVSAVDTHGNESPTTLAFPSGVTDATGGLPSALELSGVAPNPMISDAAVSWALPRAGNVRLMVLDLAGRQVRTLVDGPSSAGRHVDRWDARDQDGQAVASGVYFVVLEAGGQRLRSRVAVLR
jgi:hypothetical protein